MTAATVHQIGLFQFDSRGSSVSCFVVLRVFPSPSLLQNTEAYIHNPTCNLFYKAIKEGSPPTPYRQALFFFSLGHTDFRLRTKFDDNDHYDCYFG